MTLRTSKAKATVKRQLHKTRSTILHSFFVIVKEKGANFSGVELVVVLQFALKHVQRGSYK